MDRIVVDESFTNQLPAASVPCVVVDASGKRLGYFAPERDPTWYDGLEPTVSNEELNRRERAGGGRTLAEVLTDLSKLGQ